MFPILMAEKMSGTSVKISKNEVGCRDDTVPKTVETRRALRGGLRACNNLPQPPKTKDVYREGCCMLSILLAVPSCFNSF